MTPSLFKIRVLLKITHQIAWAQTEGIPSAEAFRPSPRWRGPPPQFHPGVGSEYSSQDSGLDSKKRVLDPPPLPLALSISFISSDHFSEFHLRIFVSPTHLLLPVGLSLSERCYNRSQKRLYIHGTTCLMLGGLLSNPCYKQSQAPCLYRPLDLSRSSITTYVFSL